MTPCGSVYLSLQTRASEVWFFFKQSLNTDSCAWCAWCASAKLESVRIWLCRFRVKHNIAVHIEASVVLACQTGPVFRKINKIYFKLSQKALFSYSYLEFILRLLCITEILLERRLRASWHIRRLPISRTTLSRSVVSMSPHLQGSLYFISPNYHWSPIFAMSVNSSQG